MRNVGNCYTPKRLLDKNVNFTNGAALKHVQVNPFLLQCFFIVRGMQSNFFRYHFGLELEKRKIVRRVHAKCILQTAPHSNHITVITCFFAFFSKHKNDLRSFCTYVTKYCSIYGSYASVASLQATLHTIQLRVLFCVFLIT